MSKEQDIENPNENVSVLVNHPNPTPPENAQKVHKGALVFLVFFCIVAVLGILGISGFALWGMITTDYDSWPPHTICYRHYY